MLSNLPSWLGPAIAALLSGTLLGVWLKHRFGMRQLSIGERQADRDQDRVDFNTILAEVKGQRDEAWREVKSQSARIDTLEAEINGLRLARDLDPFPNWVVDLQGEYIFVNREFEMVFLAPRGQGFRDIVGKKHSDIWPEAFCRVLRRLDAKAKNLPSAKATAALSIPEGEFTVVVHKFPIRVKDVTVAYAGYITDMVSDEERLA